MEGSIQPPGAAKKTVILVTSPDPRSYISRYLLAFTPLLLVVISLIATAAIRGFVAGFPTSIPTPMGSLAQGMGDMVETLILLTAPVGVFLFFVLIGWLGRSTEMWTSSALALGLSGLAGTLLVIFFPEPSMNSILDLLSWIAYLILPASIVAVVVILAWTEMFRRSISYSITNEGIVTGGGVWKRQDHILPHHQIGKLVMEQDPIMRLLHTGTIIPVVTMGPGAGASKVTANLAKAGQDASRHPLDCLYGVRDPEKIMALLEQLILRPAGRGEEQVSYLRKIYEKL
ncbi:MAG: PH domain-containing protein [Methanomicrobiales archaeon]|nr:PH domain-containing protein [Methanomicrobiales archaeon]